MKNSKPLDGIKIVEISTIITASLATMMLADQGAEVIKIEQSGIGDPMRYLGTQKGGISALFANCNRGKKSIDLDLIGTYNIGSGRGHSLLDIVNEIEHLSLIHI